MKEINDNVLLVDNDNKKQLEDLKKEVLQAEKKEKPITREQRRYIERRETEAKALHERLCQSFLTFFTESEDPEGPEVVEKWNSISARWKVYCAHKQLAPSAFPLLDTFCKSIVDTYLKAKEPIIVKESVVLPETMIE